MFVRTLYKLHGAASRKKLKRCPAQKNSTNFVISVFTLNCENKSSRFLDDLGWVAESWREIQVWDSSFMGIPLDYVKFGKYTPS